MKKIILGIVFVFASFSMINASDSAVVNSQASDEYEECLELYDNVRDMIYEITGDFDLAIGIAISVEEDCTDEVDNP